MATKSFLKSVKLRGRKEVQSLIRALERSESQREKPVKEERAPVREMDRETIRKIFTKTRTRSGMIPRDTSFS